jgi:uncharacterized protein (TIGR03067 family)
MGLLLGVLVEKAVPAVLANEAIQAVTRAAVGNATSAIPASVAALTKGVLRAMFLRKMKMVAAVLLAVSLVVTGVVVGARRVLADRPAAAGTDEAPKDEEKIVGTWAVESYVEGGQKMPEEALQQTKVILAADGKMTAKQGEREQEFTYKLDPAKKPKEIEVTNDRGQTVFGIYKLDGDTLTVCVARRGERPTEFASKEDTAVILEVLKREKK